MRPVAPRTGAPEVMYAEEQEEYLPLCVALYQTLPSIAQAATTICVMRYQLNDADRAALLAGEDLYLAMHGGVAPHSVHIGPADWMVGGEVAPENPHLTSDPTHDPDASGAP